MHFLVVAKFILGGASSRATTFRGWNSLSSVKFHLFPKLKQLKMHLFTPCPLLKCLCMLTQLHACSICCVVLSCLFYLRLLCSSFLSFCFSSKSFLSCKAKCPCVSERHYRNNIPVKETVPTLKSLPKNQQLI